MASEIQITRGSLHAKGPENLLRGELFWVPSNVSTNSENNYRANTKFPYDRGTLYIGRPSLIDTEDKNGNIRYEAPIPIAGERAYKGMVFRGFLVNEKEINEETFRFCREGDFWIWKNHATGGTFKSADDFLKDDILLITRADYDIAPDLDENVGESKNIEYVRINASGGYAKLTYFTGEDIEATNVEDAINELNRTKIEYRGRIDEDYSYAQLMTYQKNDKSRLMIGSMYLVTKDGLKFTGKNVDGNTETWTSQKGDFVIWRDDESQWVLIPSGYTDAEEIDFDPTAAVEQQTKAGTFEEDEREHISSTSALTNVQDALTYLLSHKAMLDSNGKVPLSQLHQTVLGAMQYCGVWDPINDPQGVSDPQYQNPWPNGLVNEDINGDEEGSGSGKSSIRGNKNGDYYVVKVSDGTKNIQYYDKDSTPIGDLYSRCEELNSGDWIVYQVDPETQVASWQIIDNSDAISALNFTINGTHTSGEADYASKNEHVSLVGTPEFAATDKLVLWQKDNVINVAGVRLIDQDKYDPNRNQEDRYLPVYTGNTDTLKRSSIENFYSSEFSAYVTHTNSNVIIGDASTTFDEYIYGDIYVRPKLKVVNGVNKNENSVIKFQVLTSQGSTAYKTATLKSDDNVLNGTQIVLPDRSSKVIGKLEGVSLIRNRILKVQNSANNTGYLDNSSIEEHMKPGVDSINYSDSFIESIEFHAPVVDVNNIETRHITFGQKKNLKADLANGGELEDGRLLSTEKTSDLYATPVQQKSNVINYLPAESGTLLNDNDWKRDINGTTGTLPIYGEDDLRDGEGTARKTLIDSKITQVSGALFQALFNTESKISEDSRTLGEKAFVNNPTYKDETDVDFASRMYDERVYNEDGTFSKYAGTGTEENVNVKVDTVVGEIAKGTNGYYVKTPHSLLVTKSFLLGNSETNTTHVVPGRRLFPNSSQYRYAKNEHPLPLKDVYVEPPAVSGVLLTDNSRIDGGCYIDG